MFLENYHQPLPQGFAFSREQASHFAKGVAADFNPIHDEDAKRFCVPGDLLFAVLLSRIGLHQKMHCYFSGMVGSDVGLQIDLKQDEARIIDSAGKEYLDLTFAGDNTHDAVLIEKVVRRYVRFSGQNFPPILVPLMQEKGVMVNPARPLVMYQSMAIELDSVDLKDPIITFSHATMDVEGKRGKAHLHFDFIDGGKVVGRGEKLMLLSGVVAYEQAEMDKMVAFYNGRKEGYTGNIADPA